MARRTILAGALALAAAAPAAAATPPPTRTPQQAVDAVRRVVQRTMRACATDWAKISAVGYEGDWRVDVRIRDSQAGDGTARWQIGDGWPVARNALARALARGCPTR